MRHIAVEGRCFVLSACQFARRGDFPKDYSSTYGEDQAQVVIRGGSCIVNPFGEVLAGPVYDEQVVLSAEVDLGDIVRGKYDLDVTGHYGRPDIFRLQVDERPGAVEFDGGPGASESQPPEPQPPEPQPREPQPREPQ
jgi:nitrilase